MLSHKSDESTAAINKIRAQPGQSDAKIEAIVCDLGLLKDVQQVCQEQAKKLDRLDLVSDTYLRPTFSYWALPTDPTS